MSDVFLSYSHADDAIVQVIEMRLRERGFAVDWDGTFQIAVGATLRGLIDERCRSATCVLVIWSRSAVQSEWVHAEAKIGVERRRLLQVTLDGTIPPGAYANYIYGNLRNWDRTVDHRDFQRVMEGIRFFQARATR